MLSRRQILAAGISALECRAGSKFDRSRLSVLTDEIGTLDEAIAFAKQYRLKWIEYRAYRPMAEGTRKEIRRKLDAAGIGISFFNSALLKFTHPGTTAVKWEDFYEDLYKKDNLTPEKLYESRERDLQSAIDSAKALGAAKIRTFTHWRVANPESMLPRLRETLRQMVAVASRQGIDLCVENEAATNTGTSAEAADLLKAVPGLKLNWDPQNSVSLGESKPFPAGFAMLPKGRIANVQIKAEGLIGPGEAVDWPGIFRALERSGYDGCFGLETHTLKSLEINVPASHKCMRRMIELVGEKA